MLLRYVVERLAPAFSEVVVSFGEPEQMEQLVPYRVVFDRKRDAGPLGGLEAGLIAARHDVVFAVACDMPYVTQATAQLAVAAAGNCDAAIARHDGLFEPVCGAYRKTALPAIVGALDAGSYTAHEVALSLDVTWLEGLDPAGRLGARLALLERLARGRGRAPALLVRVGPGALADQAGEVQHDHHAEDRHQRCDADI